MACIHPLMNIATCSDVFESNPTTVEREGLAVIGRSSSILSAMDDHEWGLLTDVERERARSFRNDDSRQDFVAAHLLVRSAAAMLTGMKPDIFIVEQICSDCSGPHGQPRLIGHPDLHVSLSHTNGVVAAACSRKPIGIDIEHWDNSPEHFNELNDILTESERKLLDAFPIDTSTTRPRADQLAFLRFWVRKESLVKLGALTLETLSTVDVSGAFQYELIAQRWQRRVNIEQWSFVDCSDPDLRISGCVASEGVVELIVIDE